MEWRSNLNAPKTVVIKVGSSSLCNSKGIIDARRITTIAREISALKEQGIKVLLVSSGAIACARSVPDLAGVNMKALESLQALSAVGQPLLMQKYQRAFDKLSMRCGQVLLTSEDFRKGVRYLNAKNTIDRLFSLGVVPVLNENDTVSFDEIALGDNDHLAALICEMVRADVLVMLTEADGVYDKNPKERDAQKIALIPFGTRLSFVQTKGRSAQGSGGMASKIRAGLNAANVGIACIIAKFTGPTPISRALGSDTGSLFLPDPAFKGRKRKARLLAQLKANATVNIDSGAYEAITKGASLLPSGIVSISGPFRRGDCIGLRHSRRVFAVGLAEYDHHDMQKIKGLKSTEILATLGVAPSRVVIHRNNLALKERP